MLCQKASVIVPVYNVEAYLEKCVQSILRQTEQDFELLLVDDGSTDSSGQLCEELAKKDSRIRVIHQENQGLGGARNTGIREAKGDWLLLVDSDDWIEPEILEKTLEAGLREEADMVVFPFRSVDEEGRELAVFRENIPGGPGVRPEGAQRHPPHPRRWPGTSCTAPPFSGRRALPTPPGCGTRTSAPRPSSWRWPGAWCFLATLATTICSARAPL